jgi:hypothetical protein
MLPKNKILRLAMWACLALPIGYGLLQPAQASAWEVVRVGPIVRVGPPIVRVGPVAPIVRVGPVYPGWYGYGHYGHWFGYYR